MATNIVKNPLNSNSYYNDDEIERVVGHFGNKILYRKIVKNTGTGNRSFSIGVVNTNIIKIQAFLYNSSYITQPFYFNSGDFWGYYINNSNFNFNAAGVSATNSTTIKVIIEYIKSS